MRRRDWIAVALGSAVRLAAQSGTFRVRLLGPLSTKLNEDGDTMAARVMSPPSLAGAILEGVVKKSKSSKNLRVLKTKSELLFGFHTMHLKNKTERAIDTTVLSIRNSKGKKNVDEEGQIVETATGTKRIAILAGAGAAIGGVFKRGKGAATGAAAGAAAGVILTAVSSSGPNIRFETGSEFELDVKDRS